MVGVLAPVAAVGPLQRVVLPVLALLYATPYALRARTLAREGRSVPTWRQASFVAGLVILAAALSPPVDTLADRLLVAHMAEHLLIGDIASLLIVLGLTGPLLAPLLRVRAIDRLRALSHPAVAFALWAVDLYAWHLGFAYQAALRHDGIHALEHACFFAFGANLWLPLFGPFPKPAWFTNVARLGYIVVVRLTGTVLANVFLWSGTAFYEYYRAGDAHYGIGRLADQSAAGAVMMIEESLLTIGLLGWLFMRTANEAEERQALMELAAAHGVDLDERRAARAVAAGRGADLRRRILQDDGRARGRSAVGRATRPPAE